MGEERYEENYDDYLLIAAYRGGQYQGRAWAKRKGLDNLSLIGSCVSDVVQRLKQAVQEEVRRRSDALRETLPQRHRDLLRRRGHVYQGLRPITRKHRIAHCHTCKLTVDKTVDFECIACGRAICNECAACGCGPA